MINREAVEFLESKIFVREASRTLWITIIWDLTNIKQFGINLMN